MISKVKRWKKSKSTKRNTEIHGKNRKLVTISSFTTQRKIKERTKVVGAVRTNDPAYKTEEGHIGRCELDTHADTCVAGANFLLDELTGELADVHPYGMKYEPMKDVPIVTAKTAWTDQESGMTYILCFNQILWYGQKMEHSLINPNQLRHMGHLVCDDPTDPHRRFGAELDNGIFLPFNMDGTTIFFESRVPTQ